MSKAKATFALRYAVAALLMAMAQVCIARALADAGSIKGTVKATTGATEATPAPISGARITLANRDLLGKPVKTTTDDAGNFAFANLPAANYLLTVEADGLPIVGREINLSAGQILTVEIVLTASISATVNVQEEEGLLSAAETSTYNTIRSQTLTEAPLRAENYQSSLLLTPGVVRSADGADHLKGARAGQSAYTLNGVDITDPVTGQLAFDIPLEAAANVQIEENPYS
ncbi:MAG: carboxypeptidase-like regulatory domain-containing protein, partial [Acidobacteriota bacterium]|nr:carboxypeptidase-like regulatory domain-containing protein [Acidobacteriota bacterium]